MPAAALSFPNRILFLCEDAELLRRQLDGEQLDAPPSPLCDNISTDEITPAWTCFWYDQTLGRYCLVGLRNGAVGPDAIRDGRFAVLVSGRSKGCGSSRETAPYAEKAAGVQLVIAASFEKIYRQNCQNIGLYTSTDLGLVERIRRGDAIPVEELTRGLDPLSAEVVRRGGLFPYNAARLAGRTRPPLPRAGARPHTAVEKIIARHAVVDAAEGLLGLAAVRPGEAVFCRADVRFSHDYVTAMAVSQLRAALGPGARVAEPQTVFAFRDHLTFLGEVMPEQRKRQGLLALAEEMAAVQEGFCGRQGIRLYGEHPEGGSFAICHSAVLDDIALPGQLVVGTDSHTCTAGALGCFAFGVGSTDMANAWYTRDVRVRVPASVRIELSGTLPAGVTAKDLMLHLMALPYFAEGKAIGQVLELGGPGLTAMPLEERATLTNMAVEAGAFTAVIPADAVTYEFIARARGLDAAGLAQLAVHPDPGAEYAHELAIDLSRLEPMVATPGDPRNGVPVSSLGAAVPVHLAYGGSCTGGKRSDMDLYASVLGPAVERGMRVAPGVRLYIQFGSQRVRAYAEERGYVELFRKAGAELIAPSCGACINAGPGTSTSPDQVTVSAINRNFPGRSGPGKVYLASPLVVAASALAGRIATPREVLGSWCPSSTLSLSST